MAILDSGAGVAIATKQIWNKWGRPALRKTRMKLQLADGYIEEPLGLLKNVVVTSCGIEYEHTFAVVDFGKKSAYDIILGRPFMRQLQLIQDWGYDYIYLRQEGVTTRINTKDLTYRDVARTPVEDFESGTQESADIPSWKNVKAPIWMCGASDQGSLHPDECVFYRPIEDEAYMPEPFPEEEFEPLEWSHLLATLDVCTSEKTPTKFYDENGYDIMPIMMVNCIYEAKNPIEQNEEMETPGCSILDRISGTDGPILWQHNADDVSIKSQSSTSIDKEILCDIHDLGRKLIQQNTSQMHKKPL